MCVNNGNWQFTKPLCSGIKRKLSGELWPQGSNEVERGMVEAVIFRAASTTINIFAASMHGRKLDIYVAD